MTAVPPPPPPVPPPPQEARSAARLAREQRRSAQLWARQQRSQLRTQRRALQRHSLVGPVMLVTFGVVLLAMQAGHLQTAVTIAWLGRWWPLLLLGAGLLRLAEWSWDTRLARTAGTTIVPRRRLGVGSILLILLLVALGSLSHAIPQGLSWARQNGNSSFLEAVGLDRLLAQHAEEHVSLSAPLAHGGTFTLQNERGAVTIRGESQDGQVHILAEQHLTAWQGAELQEHRQRDRPTLQPIDGGVVLTVAAEDRDRTDLTIEVPHDAAVVVQGGQGSLSLSELHAPVTVAGHQGGLELTALTGSVRVHMQDQDDTITGHSLTGDVQVDGQTGDLDFSDVSGSLTLVGDFFGSTQLNRINGPVHFRSNFTDLSCAGLPGELTIEGRNELRADHVTGPLVLSTSERNLEIADVHGATTITDRDARVHVTLASPLALTTITTTHGKLEVQVPEKLGFHLDGTTTDGQITTAYDLPITEAGDAHTVGGQVHSGGPELRLSTSQGDLVVRPRSTDDAARQDDGKRSSEDDSDHED